MANTSQYEKEILKELEGIPPEQLKKILRMIQSVKDEFSVEERYKQEKPSPDGKSLLLSLGEGVGEGPEDLADHHHKYLYN